MKIDKAGVYDLSFEDYHGDTCVGPSISAGGLEKIVECPVKYWAFSPFNPDRFPPPDTKPMSIGRAAHALALGEPQFSDVCVVSPYDDFRSKEAREWRDAQTLTVLKPDDYELVKLMAHALKIAPQVARAFENGKAERSLIWKDAETGVWLKSRPDWLPNDPRSGFIVDYKTATTIEPYALSNHAFSYGFHIQGALQCDAVKEIFGVRALGIAHVCQEKDPPYLAELRMFSEEQIDIGRKLYRRGVRKFAECMSSGIWPGYTENPEYFQTPYRVAMQAEELENAEPSNGRGRQKRKYDAVDYLSAG